MDISWFGLPGIFSSHKQLIFFMGSRKILKQETRIWPCPGQKVPICSATGWVQEWPNIQASPIGGLYGTWDRTMKKEAITLKVLDKNWGCLDRGHMDKYCLKMKSTQRKARKDERREQPSSGLVMPKAKSCWNFYLYESTTLPPHFVQAYFNWVSVTYDQRGSI